MFKAPPMKQKDTRLQDLMFSQNSVDHIQLSPRPINQPSQQQCDQPSIAFQQNNVLQQSGMQFSQSFTYSYRQSGRQMSNHNINNSVLQKQLLKKDQLLAFKDLQIKQLTDFLNKKKKQQGNVNTIIDQELNRTAQQITKKQILIIQLNKKINFIEEQSKKDSKCIEQQAIEIHKLHKDIDKFQESNNCLNQYISELNQLIEQSNKRVEILELQNTKLSEENRRISEVLADNVVQIKPRIISSKSYLQPTTTSPRNFNADITAFTQKFKQQKQKLQSQLLTITTKYDDLKRRHLLKDKSISELKQQIKTLQSTLITKQKQLQHTNKAITSKSDQLIKSNNQKIIELQKRIKYQKQELQKKQNKNLCQLNEIAEKNKMILVSTKNENQMKNRLLIQEKKTEQARKQIKILNQKITGLKDFIKSTQKQMQNKEKTKQLLKQYENNKIQLNKTLDKMNKQINQKDMLISQMKKKLEQLQRKHLLLKSKSNDDTQIKDLKQQLLNEKQKVKKFIIQAKKKNSQIQLLQNKIILLQARVSSSQSHYHNRATQQQQLQDRIQGLEIIIQSKDRQIEQRNRQIQQLHLRLELHESDEMDIQKQISHDLINYNMKQINENNSSVTISYLKQELSEKYQIIEALKRDLEMKDKSVEFAMQKFLKSEREKLLMQQTNIKMKGTRYTQLEDSVDQVSYQQHQNNPQQQHYYQILIQRCQSLQQRNRGLQLQLKNLNSSQTLKHSTSSKFQTIMLKNQIKDLKQQLLKSNSQNKRRNNLQKLSSTQLIQLLYQLLKRIYKSSQLIKMVNKSTQIMELVKRLVRQKQSSSTSSSTKWGY